MREIAGLRLDPFRREVFRDGRYVALTRKQFAVLEVLVAAEGGVVSAEELLERAWDEQRRPLHQRRAHHGLRPAQTTRRTLADRHGARRRLPHRHRHGASADRVHRRPGLSARLKLTLSYAGFLLLAGALLLAVVWVFLLRYVPEVDPDASTAGRFGTWIITGARTAPTSCAPSPPPRPRRWPSCWCSACWEAGSSPAGCSRRSTRITDAARMAANGSLSHRIRMDGREDEFRELADVFDTMLDRLESHVAEQQRFAANASHELRTPLAISQTLLDVARNDPARRAGANSSNASTRSTRGRSTSPRRLLLLSRADTKKLHPRAVDLSLLAEEAAETLLPLAEQRGGSRWTSPARRRGPSAPRNSSCGW